MRQLTNGDTECDRLLRPFCDAGICQQARDHDVGEHVGITELVRERLRAGEKCRRDRGVTVVAGADGQRAQYPCAARRVAVGELACGRQ